MDHRETATGPWETPSDRSAADGAAGSLGELEKRLGYSFRHPLLLKRALSHRSYADEQSAQGMEHNETLEFLGDAILGFFISRTLFHRFPEAKVGALAKAKSYLVSSTHLYQLSESIHLGDYLLLSSAEDKALGRKKKALLADAYEAMIAALYLDGGMEAAEQFLARQFDRALQEVDILRAGHTDFKSTLLEQISLQKLPEPRFRVLGETGPQHDKTFRIGLEIPHLVSFSATGRTKKECQQAASRLALECMEAWIRARHS